MVDARNGVDLCRKKYTTLSLSSMHLLLIGSHPKSPAGSSLSTSRFACTPEERDVSSGSAPPPTHGCTTIYNSLSAHKHIQKQGPLVEQPLRHGCPDVGTQYTQSTNVRKVTPSTRLFQTVRKVLCTHPPTDAAAGMHEPTKTRVDGLVPPRKEQTKSGLGGAGFGIRVLPQAPRTKRTQLRERPTSSLSPPRDPLLHPAMITPPCPIPRGQQETPMVLRSYKHVSAKKKK